MKLGYIKVNEKQYTACLSTRVIINIKNYTGKDFEAGINEILGGGNFEGLFWLMAQMLDAGMRYKTLIGEDADMPPTEEDLLDLLGVDDYDGLVDILTNAALDSAAPDVAVESSEKNAKTTKQRA